MSRLSPLADIRFLVGQALNVLGSVSIGGVSASCFVKTSFEKDSLAYNLSMEGMRVYELVIYSPPPTLFNLLANTNSRNCATINTDIRTGVTTTIVVNKLNKQTDGTLYALCVETTLL